MSNTMQSTMEVPNTRLMPQKRCLLVKPLAPRPGDLRAREEARAAKWAEPEMRAYREMMRPRAGPDTVSRCSISWAPSYTFKQK